MPDLETAPAQAEELAELLCGALELPAFAAERPLDELRRTRERLDGLLQAVSDGVTVVDRTGRLAYANHAAAAIHGQPSAAAFLLASAEELRLGVEVTDAAGKPRADVRDLPRDELLRFRTRDQRGRPHDRYCAVRTSPVNDGEQRTAAVVAVFRDVTEQKRAEAGLRFLSRSGALLAGTLDSAALLTGVLRLAVPEVADLCAVDLAAEEDEPPRSLALHVSAPAGCGDGVPSQAAVRAMASQRAELISLEVPDPSGELHDGELRALGLTSALVAPLVARGRVLGALTLGTTDARPPLGQSELSLAEDLAARLALALENARLQARARETDRRRDEFLALLAHELRNPLAPVVTAIALLEKGAPVADELRLRAVMGRQVGHLVRLVDDLLDVSRITRGKVELRKEPVELATLIARAVETSGPLLERGGHRLVVTLPRESVVLSADPVRLTQVVANLLNNAARYSETGGMVRIDAGRSGGQLEVRVCDEGIGIPGELLDRIFEPFVQGRARQGEAKAGLGIGLTLARGLVELHGGSLRAASDGPGRGSVFVMRLPEAKPEMAEARSSLIALTRPLVRRRVLVVDDNVDAAELLRDALELHGHEVTLAHDGAAALQLAGRELPEVALLDIGLPGMSGHELARQLRTLAAGRPLRLVALSGYGREADRQRSAEAGIDAHYTKPIDLGALNEAIQ